MTSERSDDIRDYLAREVEWTKGRVRDLAAELSVSGAARQIGFTDRDEITLTFRAGATWTTS